MRKKTVLFIVGPTAVGKTALSLALAQRLNGEIISSDSRLFYRGMDIGTAKPSVAEQTAVPHHLIDICNPNETITLGSYQDKVYALIEKMARSSSPLPLVSPVPMLPIIVGGTGQYMRAIVEGWGIPRVPPQPRLRAALEALGGAELGRWLREFDEKTAVRLDVRNVRRVVRALEVILVSGQRMSYLQRKTPPPYNFIIIGLRRDRLVLYQRIDDRVDAMMATGLLAELEQLRDDGYGRWLPSMSGLGYRQLWAYLDGEMTLPEAVERIKFETHRFVRHQNNWFKPTDPQINWYDLDEMEEAAVLNGVETAVDEAIAATDK